MPLLSSCLDYCQTFINFCQICHFYKIVIFQDAPFCHLISIWPNSWTLHFCRNLPFSYNRHLSSLPSLSPHLSFCQTFDKFLLNPPFSQFSNFVKSQNCQYCWSALDVTAPMLMVKNKSIWEPNSIFMLIIREKLYCIDAQHCLVVANQECLFCGLI